MGSWHIDDLKPEVESLRRYALSLARDADAAEELVQEALLKAYERNEVFDDRRSLRPWLFSILRNQFLMRKRSDATRERHYNAYAATLELDHEQLSPEQLLHVRDVAQSFGRLCEQHRSVLHLVGVEGFSYREAAETLDVPLGTIMSRLARARAALRELLSDKTSTPLRIVGGNDDS
jgi:RNA polymerase sigma-70 factor (ECF subfamily)